MKNCSLSFDLTAGCVILRFAVPSLNTWRNSTSTYRQNITASVEWLTELQHSRGWFEWETATALNSITHFLHSETGEAQYVGEIHLLRQKYK